MACRITSKTLGDVSKAVLNLPNVSGPDMLREVSKLIETFRKRYSILENKTTVSAGKVAREMVEAFKERYKNDPELIPSYITEENLTQRLFLDDAQIARCVVDATEEMSDCTDNERAKVSRLFFYDAYGENRGLISFVEQSTSRDLVDVLFIDRREFQLYNSEEDNDAWDIANINEQNNPYKNINTNTAINRRINAYLNYLFRRVRKYLISKAETEDERLFLATHDYLYSDLDYSGVLETAEWKRLVSKYLKTETAQKEISNLYSGENASGNLQFKAYNALTILENFDNYLRLLLPKILLIDPTKIGVRCSGEKYKLATNTTSVQSNYRSTEDIDIDKETNNITKLIINTTRLYSFATESVIGDRYLTFNDWGAVISRVKDLLNKKGVFNNTLGRARQLAAMNLSDNTLRLIAAREYKSLGEMIADSIQSPHTLLPAIFDILASKAFYNLNRSLYEDFNTDLMNKLYTIHRKMFHDSDSLQNIQDPNENLNYFNHIILSTTTIYKSDLYQYLIDSDGSTIGQIMLSNVIRNKLRALELRITGLNNGTFFRSWALNAVDLGIEHAYYGTYDNMIEFSSPSLMPSELYNQIATNTVGTIKLVIRIPNTDIVITVDNKQSSNVSINKKTFTAEETNTCKQYIKKVLGLDLINNSNLYDELLEKYPDTLLTKFLEMSSRVVYNKFVQNTIINSSDITARRVHKAIFKSGNPIITGGKISLLHRNDYAFSLDVAEAMAVLDGLTTASTVLDGEGNANSTYTFNRLYNSAKSLWRVHTKQENNPASHFTLIHENDLMCGMVNMKESYDVYNGTKATVTMSAKELYTASFLYDYIAGRLKVDNDKGGKVFVGNGKILIMPAVVSDKSLSGKLLIDLNVTPKSGNGKALADYTKEEIIELTAKELGQYYIKMKESINNELNKLTPLFRQLMGDEFAPDVSNLDAFNRYITDHYNETPAEIIDSLIRTYNELHPTNPVTLIDLTHYRVLNGNLYSNPIINAQIQRYTSVIEYTQFYAAKERELVINLLDNDVRFDLTDKSKDINEYLTKGELRPWVNRSGNLILCKVTLADGRTIDVSSVTDARRLEEEVNKDLAVKRDWRTILNSADVLVELHPEVARHNALDHFVSLEFLNATVGSFTNHPFKGRTIEELEASLQDAQNKRNLALSAPVQLAVLNTLYGISGEYKVAVIEELLDVKGTVNGHTYTINGADGATWVNPFTEVLENNSLGGNSTATNKKPFVASYSEKTGTGIIVKTASFGLNNANIRDSELLQRMMKKMTDIAWRDLDGNLFNANIESKAINGYKPMYFERDGRWYRIKSISLDTEAEEPNSYLVRILEVDGSGNPLIDDLGAKSPLIVERHTNINSNYKLWKLFGGERSMEVINGRLEYSNTSVENVVQAMNQITIDLNNGESENSQLRKYQPLKHSDINWICGKGAIKQGAANINSRARWNDDTSLNWFTMGMQNFGILLDKEHAVDYDDVAAPTQANTSSALRLFSAKACGELYNALANLSHLNTGSRLDTIRKLVGNPDDATFIQLFREEMKNAMLSALLESDGNYTSFALAVTRGIINRAQKKGYTPEIPYSDNNLFSKVHLEINTFFTEKGIKLRLPGVLAVLTPSYGIMKLYGGKKLSHTSPELLLALLLQYNDNPVYEVTNEGKIVGSTADIKLDRTYSIRYNTELNPTDVYVDIHEYLNLKKAIREGRVQKIVEKVWDEDTQTAVGRDLASYNVYFSDTEGQRFLLYDLDSIQTLFELEDLTTSQKPNSFDALKTKITNIQSYIENHQSLSDSMAYHDYKISSEFISGIDQILNALHLGLLLRNATTKLEVDRIKELVAPGNNKISTEELLLLLRQDYAAKVLVLVDRYNSQVNSGDQIKYNPNTLTSRGVNRLSDELINKVDGVVNKYGDQAKKIVHRWKQFDLNNLSLENYERVEEYNNLVQQIEKLQNDDPDSPELNRLYDKYALCVNIKFGLHTSDVNTNDLSRLREYNPQTKTYGRKMNIRSVDDFRNVNSYVSRWMEALTSVRINGEAHTVNRNNIEVDAYEIIAPNRWSEEFGLSTNADVQEIVNNPDYFITLLKRRTATKMDDANYSMEFKVNNGKHIYVIDRSQVQARNLSKLDNVYILNDDGHRYRVTNDGRRMYELCNYNDMELLEGQQRPQDEIYTDVDGNEVIVTDLGRSSQFYVNNLSYSSIRLSRELLSEGKLGLLIRVLNSIETSDNKEAQSISGYATLANRYYGVSYEGKKEVYPTKTLTSIFNRIEQYNQGADNASWIYRRGREMHTSFLRQLNLLAARTPGHSMLSFMAMKIVGFTEVNNNMTYVSTMQNLLQGSDFDIDTTTLMFFDVSKNGTIPLWSPYAVTTSLEMFRASEKLPLPTGRTTEITRLTQDANEVINFFTKYESILNLLVSQLRNAEPNDIDVTLKEIDTPEKMELLVSFLQEASSIAKPIQDTEVYAPIIQHLNNTYRTGKVYNVFARDLAPARQIEIMEDIFELIQTICDVHNMYLSEDLSFSTKHIGRGLRTKIFNNYLISNQMRIINDPANLTQSLTSTDAMVEPYKDIANSTDIAKKTKSLGNGDVFAKFILFCNALVGKQDVGISAVVSKIIGALSLYVGTVIRSQDPETLKFLFQKGRYKNGESNYRDKLASANAYVNDPFAYDNLELLSALARVDNDTDYSLTIGSLVALSADNGKDPILGKLNAISKFIGLYGYTALMGDSFEATAELLTSEIGLIAARLLQTDNFSGQFGFSNAYQLRKYFTEQLDWRFLEPFSTTKNPNNDSPDYESVLDIYTRVFKSTYKNYTNQYKKWLALEGKRTGHEEEYEQISNGIYDADKTLNFGKLLFSLGSFKLGGRTIKQDILREVREKINKIGLDEDSYQRQRINLLADLIEDYVITIDNIYRDSRSMNQLRDILFKAEGAEESRVLGLMLGVNQKIEVDPVKSFRQIDNFESAIYNRKHILGLKTSEADMIDLVLFAFNEEYRNEKILEYEKIKHSINILAAATTNPHYMAYIESLAGALVSNSLGYVYKNTRSIIHQLRTLKMTNVLKLIPGVRRFLNDRMCNEWLRSEECKYQFINIPGGNMVFDSNINSANKIGMTRRDVRAPLGTDYGNATFRLFMEQVVIPQLKEMYPDNDFIKGLTPVSINRTTLGNPVNVYSLDINMMPRNDAENTILTKYKQAFADLKTEKDYLIIGVDGLVLLSIPITDLFTLYTMIAHGWRTNTSSLMPILEGLYSDSSLIHSFHDFESHKDMLTQNNEVGGNVDLSSEEVMLLLAPYVAVSENPFTSMSKYIKRFNWETRQYDLYERIEEPPKSGEYGEENEIEAEMMQQAEEEAAAQAEAEGYEGEGYQRRHNPNKIGNYKRIAPTADYDYFPTGLAQAKSNRQGQIYTRNEEVELSDGTKNSVEMKFVLNTVTPVTIDRKGNVFAELSNITVNGKHILELVKEGVISEKEKNQLMKVQLIKKDGGIHPNIDEVVDVLKHKQNPC